MKAPIDRFMEKVSPEPMSGCWLWAGAMDPCGYGSFRAMSSKPPVRAHRFIYEHDVGPIGEHLVLHKCDNRLCVNTVHLYLGDRLRNTMDAMQRSRLGEASLRACAVQLFVAGRSPKEVALALGIHVVCAYMWRRWWLAGADPLVPVHTRGLGRLKEASA